MTQKILLVDDDKPVREALCQTLELAGFDVISAASFIEATDHISADFNGVVLSDVRMPGKDGFALLARCKQIDLELPVILLTGQGDVPSAVRAMEQGALNFLEKPVSHQRLSEVVTQACMLRATVIENRKLKAQLAREDVAERLVIGQSETTQNLRRQLRAVADSGSDALISGETGVGKELAARVIHQLSKPRSPFIAINCGMLTQGLTGSVLFGDKTRQGAFARADGGTLFLDEIGAMPLDQQVNLLRILEDRQLELASGQVKQLKIRVLAASYQDLPDMVSKGLFRDDLFFRLDVARIFIPPLRERPEDIGILMNHFLQLESDAEIPLANAFSLADLVTKPWPGNMRELRNHARRMAIGLNEHDTLPDNIGLSTALDRVETRLIEQALQKHASRMVDVCADLKIPRKTLYDRMNRLKINPADFR
ncbi:MAG: sigma-54 dependent transcriptional regulator [Rhodobacteraceae bacterium]|nr:sigma-54 dependent transcriptional regulator [Paracoccaceae bacterium]